MKLNIHDAKTKTNIKKLKKYNGPTLADVAFFI